MDLRAPFPYFGGKRRVAAEVWRRFGVSPDGSAIAGVAPVVNYVEPFFGSGAVLLANPARGLRSEIVNDADALVANFWRAVKADPDRVADEADHPVNEVDLDARHRWIVARAREIGLAERLRGDPDHADPVIAGRWAWGLSCWIGRGWCDGLDRDADEPSSEASRQPPAAGRGTGKRPALHNPGKIERRRNKSRCSGATGESAPPRQIPDITGSRGCTIPDSRLPTPDSRLPTPDSRLPKGQGPNCGAGGAPLAPTGWG